MSLLYLSASIGKKAVSNETRARARVRARAADTARVSARFRALSVSRAAGQTGLPSYRLADALPLLLPTAALFMFINCAKSFTSVKCSENEIGR